MALSCATLATACSNSGKGSLLDRTKLGTSRHAGTVSDTGLCGGSWTLTNSDSPLSGKDNALISDFLRDEVFPHSELNGSCDFGSVMRLMNRDDGFKGASSGIDFTCTSSTAAISEMAQQFERYHENGIAGLNARDYRFVTRTICRAENENHNFEGLPETSDGSEPVSPPSFGILFSTFGVAAAQANTGFQFRDQCEDELNAQTERDFRALNFCSDDVLTASAAEGGFGLEFSTEFGPDKLKPCFEQQGEVFPDSSQKRCFVVGTGFDGAGFEAMAFGEAEDDETSTMASGVYNFYVADPRSNAVNYRGSSNHFQKEYLHQASMEDFRSRSHDNSPFTNKQRCGSCHQSGGLIQKELPSPWVHWEHFTVTPGAQAIIAEANDDLGINNGGSFDGASLESLVNQANRHVVRGKIERLAARGDIKGLLRPIFCPTELNFGSSASTMVPDPNNMPSSLPLSSNMFVDRGLANNFRPPSVPYNDYRFARQAIGQEIKGLPFDNNAGFPDEFPGSAVRDTFFENTFIERSGVDALYIGLNDQFPDGSEPFQKPSSLVALGLIRPATVRAILSIDMTRPVVSNQRCGLIARLPESMATPIPLGSGAGADIIENELRAAMEAESDAGSAAGARLRELLDHTQTPLVDAGPELPAPTFGATTVGEAVIDLAVSAYSQACQARASSDPEFAEKVLRSEHDRINSARLPGTNGKRLHFIEFPAAIPTSNVREMDGDLAFDPLTCDLLGDDEPFDRNTFVDWEVDFCAQIISSNRSNPLAGAGAYCFDPMKGHEELWGNAVERPAGQTLVNCPTVGTESSQINAINSGCFNGCRRMRNGADDQCTELTLNPGFDICEKQEALEIDGTLGTGKTVQSFCDDPAETGAADRFQCGDFGSASRLWCKNSCDGDFITSRGGQPTLVDVDGDGVISARCLLDGEPRSPTPDIPDAPEQPTLGNWESWNERGNSSLDQRSTSEVVVNGSNDGGNNGFNGGVFQQVCGLPSDQNVLVTVETSWSPQPPTEDRWTELLLDASGSFANTGADALPGGSITSTAGGAQGGSMSHVSPAENGCVSIILKAGTFGDPAEGPWSVTFRNIQIQLLSGGGGGGGAG